MADWVLFVDLENVQRFDPTVVPTNARILVFYATTQKKLPEDLVVKAQPFGTRLTWIKIAGQGPNALDFHIAFYLGETLAKEPAAECAILSGDTGFDPLVKHLQALGRSCKRVTSLQEAFPAQPDLEADHFDRLLRLLRKEKARPARRRGLTGKVKSWFPGLTDDARLALIQRLFDQRSVCESGNVLTYDF